PKMEKKVQSCFIPDCQNTSSQELLYPFLIDTNDINSRIMGVGSPELVQNVPEDRKRICEQYFLCTDHINFLDSTQATEKIEKADEESAEDDAKKSEEESPDQLSQQLSSLTVSQPREDPDDVDVAGMIEAPETEKSEDYIELENISQDLNSIFEVIPEDFTNVCRLCGRCTDDPLPIFSGGNEGDELSLVEKIRYYLPIKVDVNDSLPKVICRECSQHLDKSHDLAITSLATEALLTGSVSKEELMGKNAAGKDGEKVPVGSDELVTSIHAENRNEGNYSQKNVSDAVHLDCSQSLITSDEDEAPFTTFEGLKVLRTYGKKRPLPQGAGGYAVKKKREEAIFETWYKCNMCVASCTDLQVIKFHKHRHRLRRPVLFWCSFCATEFPKESTFTNHVLAVHKKEPWALSHAYKCITCHRVFSLKTTAQTHYDAKCAIDLGEENGTKICAEPVYLRYAYTCEFCWQGYAYVSSLNTHRNQEHPEENPRVKGIEISETKRRDRIMELCGIKRAFACKFCSKIFTSLENFVQHREEHLDGLFRCSICKGSFWNYEDFKQHRGTQHDYKIILREVSGEQLDENGQTTSSSESESVE
ncbi:zinc finger protein 59, partial [Diachasma alloeum]|uniref:zinc finger protein 59 n=1 Tax=Diachasma alloeum TaxID=454923 RepID=UPI0007383F65